MCDETERCQTVGKDRIRIGVYRCVGFHWIAILAREASTNSTKVLSEHIPFPTYMENRRAMHSFYY